MKVFSRIVIDIETGKVEESESFEYNGPVAECKGGGESSTTTTTIDYAYNARMATLAEQQQAMANEYFKFWEQSYKPMEQAQIAANTSLIGVQTEAERAKSELEKETATSQLGLLPQQTELAGAQLGLGLQKTALESEQTQARSEELALAKPVVSEYYKQALRGVDVGEKVGEAQATTAQAFKGTDAALARTMGRYGITPSSDRAADLAQKKSIEQAKATGAAMTAAKTGAEEENYKRLGDASKYFKGGI